LSEAPRNLASLAADSPAIRPEAHGLGPIAARVAELLGPRMLGEQLAYGELTITVEAESIVEVVTTLRDDPELQFISFIDIAVDWPARERRFDVVYHLLSPRKNARIRVKLATDADTPVPSLSDVFPAATWFEREAYDLYGILFTGNPDLRRILTDYGFRGYPLRKDFPLTGYVEVRYDDTQRRVVYEPVKLPQEFRNFDFESPWEGPDYVLHGDEKATQ
jgi:NADH-quinone oxidoreductase subunit C